LVNGRSLEAVRSSGRRPLAREVGCSAALTGREVDREETAGDAKTEVERDVSAATRS
jgi:hypothetical protein